MNRIGNDVPTILKKYGKNIKPKDMKVVEKVMNSETKTGRR